MGARGRCPRGPCPRGGVCRGRSGGGAPRPGEMPNSSALRAKASREMTMSPGEEALRPVGAAIGVALLEGQDVGRLVPVAVLLVEAADEGVVADEDREVPAVLAQAREDGEGEVPRPLEPRRGPDALDRDLDGAPASSRLLLELGILDARVEMPRQDAREAVADRLQVLEREVAAVELAVLHLVHDDLADEVLEARRGRLLEACASRPRRSRPA